MRAWREESTRNFGALRREREIILKGTKGRKCLRKGTMTRDSSPASQFC